MKKQHRTAKESYRVRTHLIHGNHESKHWDFDHHLVPPISASAAYRLGNFWSGTPKVASVSYPGLEPGGIRLSIGLEDWHDIIGDLQTALEQI